MASESFRKMMMHNPSNSNIQYIEEWEVGNDKYVFEMEGTISYDFRKVEMTTKLTPLDDFFSEK